MQELNDALFFDSKTGADMVKDLDAIAQQLSILGMRYPNTFDYLSETAKGTGEMNLQDAAMAIGWALNHVAEGGE